MNTQKRESNIIGLKELRNNVEKYISQVEKGKSFTVVRRSRPVFRITSPDEDDNWDTVADFTRVQKGGISASALLSSLKNYDTKNR